MMTSPMTSHGGLKFGPLYSFINEITTYFMIPKKRADISSLNFLCISVRRLLLHLCKRVFMTSLMTSPGHKVGQILKLIYLRQYRSKTQNIGNAYGYLAGIFFFRYNIWNKVCRDMKMATIFQNFEILNTTVWTVFSYLRSNWSCVWYFKIFKMATVLSSRQTFYRKLHRKLNRPER